MRSRSFAYNTHAPACSSDITRVRAFIDRSNRLGVLTFFFFSIPRHTLFELTIFIDSLFANAFLPPPPHHPTLSGVTYFSRKNCAFRTTFIAIRRSARIVINYYRWRTIVFTSVGLSTKSNYVSSVTREQNGYGFPR